MNKSLQIVLFVAVIGTGFITMVGSGGGTSPPLDGDGDGWFDASTNAAMVVTLTAAAFPGSPVPGGGFEILIDEVRFPLAPLLNGRFAQPFLPASTTIGVPVATRVRGVQGAGAGGTPFAFTVRTLYHPPAPPGIPLPSISSGDIRVRFGETPGALPPVTATLAAVGTVTLTFTVATTSFADPNPMNAMGDADADGIPEAAEATLDSRFRGIFDPRAGSAGDIDMVIGRTDPAYTLIEATRQDLRSRFIQRNINLHLDEGTLNGMNGDGGQMNLAGTGVVTPPGDVITTMQLTAVRNLNVPPARRATAQFVLLGTRATLGGGTTFGFSIPGAMAYAAGFPVLGGTTIFQKGMLMHELGHSIGLCHPVAQDGVTTGTGASSLCSGVCGAVPVSERVGSASVMGAPADDPNPLVAGWNAVTRPDDYSLSQWPLIRLGCSLTP